MHSIRKFVIIGSGNVATHLSKAILNAGMEICGIYSRSEKNAQILAQELKVKIIPDLDNIPQNADACILAVSDSALEEVVEKLSSFNGILMHTSGSISLNVFPSNHTKTAVFYPLQTFSKAKTLDFSRIPILLESKNESVLQLIKELAGKLSSNTLVIDSAQRKQLHVAAVFACNFSNYMFHIASDLVSDADLNFEILKPLIKETVEKLNSLSPKEAQTGPAARNDIKILNTHLSLLENHQDYRNLYQLISNQIRKTKNINMNYKEKLKHITTLIFDYDGVLTDGTVYPSSDGEMMRAANVKDGYALQLAVKKGFNVAVISGGKSATMTKRLEALNIQDVHLGVKDKVGVFHQYLADKNLKKEQVLYMGDDIPDFQIMQEVGVATCPEDAVEEIKSISDYISHKEGGKGAVRDIVQQVMKIQGKWMDGEAFHW
ncbi:MAG: DUF2520 domain-containing protein [Bacteroidota bacterium]